MSEEKIKISAGKHYLLEEPAIIGRFVFNTTLAPIYINAVEELDDGTQLFTYTNYSMAPCKTYTTRTTLGVVAEIDVPYPYGAIKELPNYIKEITKKVFGIVQNVYYRDKKLIYVLEPTDLIKAEEVATGIKIL